MFTLDSLPQHLLMVNIGTAIRLTFSALPLTRLWTAPEGLHRAKLVSKTGRQ